MRMTLTVLSSGLVRVSTANERVLVGRWPEVLSILAAMPERVNGYALSLSVRSDVSVMPLVVGASVARGERFMLGEL